MFIPTVLKALNRNEDVLPGGGVVHCGVWSSVWVVVDEVWSAVVGGPLRGVVRG